MTSFEKLKKISNLRQRLSAMDYKAQKNIEYEKMGLPLPYDWATIHSEKEQLRQQINELQGVNNGKN